MSDISGNSEIKIWISSVIDTCSKTIDLLLSSVLILAMYDTLFNK